ncbi:flagellar hook-length control protein FliK [Clostridium sp. P21]|uniref:Flagellar hook-length control protein FliK n=1 Tax=Clostridium muellerianum TaxID=2716538 RepID=A0A7Y0EDF9_9CLOT|nr:flagellar hook-length control protein FliK [Clostridium muellerianum]NMM61451.1 flagellar hook-length control protein FliK [Clostridium muellerianum]
MNMNVLSVVNNNSSNYKSDISTSKDNNSTFNTVLSKTNSVNQDSQTLNKNNKSQDLKDSKFEVSEETKKALKEAGLSDKDIENIKSPDDLKSVIVEKVLSGDSDSKIDLDKLLMILAALLKVDAKDLQNLKAKTISEIKDALDTIVKAVGDKEKNIATEKLSQILSSVGDKVKEVLDKNFSKVQDPTVRLLLTKEVMDQIEKEVIPQITENLSKVNLPEASGDILTKIQQELKLALSSSLKDVNTDNNIDKNSKSTILDFKETYREISNSNTSELAVASKKQDSDKNSSLNKETSKEDNFLKSLTSDTGKEDKISKATNFMTQFNNVNKNIKVEDVADMVINKNNITNDVIKTIKYMETNNIKNLTVKIAPKELGEVIIKLTVEGGVMKASIGASNKEAFNLLNSNITDMTQKLQNNDTKINSLSLNIYNEDTTFFKDGSNSGNNQNGKNNKKAKAIGAIEETTNELEDQNEIDSNVNILA